MQKVSANYERLRNSQNSQYEWKITIDGVGEFLGSQLFSINTDLKMFSTVPEVGKAVAGEADVVMLMPSGEIPTMARFTLFAKATGIAPKSSTVTMTGSNLASDHATYSNGNITFDAQSGAEVVGTNLLFAADSTEYVESEWIPQGVYYIDTREVTANQDGLDVLTIHGYDAMLKAEQDYASNAVIGDNYDTAYVLAIAGQMGVEVDSRTWDIMGAGHIITFPLGYSCREILGYIAGIYIGCFVMTDEGKLRLVSLLTLPPETNLLIDDVGDVLVFGNDAILI